MKHNFSSLEPDDVEVEEVEEGQFLSATDAYIDFLFPKLLAGENIALFRKRNKDNFYTEFFQNKEHLKRLLNNGLKDCDTYISLSTCVAVNGKLTKSAENMKRRYCLGFDFDKKDFKGKLDNIYEFTEHFKKSTGLFIHYAIDSGHGYHFYVGIEETTAIARVNSITRRYALLCGADRVNISEAQSLRLPSTLNHKDKEFPLSVNVVSVYTNNDKFRRYTLDFLESKLRKLEKAAGIERSVTPRKSITRKFKGMYPCIANILNNGVLKGERNKCLARIVSYFRDVARLNDNSALKIVLQWNAKCNALCEEHEQKSDDEVTKDFNRLWKPQKPYNFLGCVSNRNSFSSILVKYCDKELCPKHRRGPAKDSTQFFALDNRYVTDKCLCNLKGYAYVIIKVLLDNKKDYKVSELVTLTGFSEQTVSRTLKSLVDLELIHKSADVVNTYKAKNFAAPKEKQFVTLPIKLFDMLVDKEIREQELLLYIAIRRNAYTSKKCTQAELGKLLDLTEKSISRTAKHMVGIGLLEVELRKTGNTIKKGGKTIEKSFNFYRFPLEERSDEDADNEGL